MTEELYYIQDTYYSSWNHSPVKFVGDFGRALTRNVDEATLLNLDMVKALIPLLEDNKNTTRPRYIFYKMTNINRKSIRVVFEDDIATTGEIRSRWYPNDIRNTCLSMGQAYRGAIDYKRNA